MIRSPAGAGLRQLAGPLAESYVLGMRVLRTAVVLFGVLLSNVMPAWAQGGLASFERGTLTIETAAGQAHRIEIELALTPDQQAQGLMHRRDLAPDAGMLFIYPRDRPVSMWMKNTLIPLDMLFLMRDGRIVKVVERAVPLSLQTISSDEAVAAVLELNGGTVDRLGIAAGDRILHPDLGGGS